jgi:DUF1680 family protein
MAISRRNFVRGAVTLVAASRITSPSAFSLASSPTEASPAPRRKLQAFNYSGVTLADSRLKAQFTATRNFYFNISNDDILRGFRQGAGLPAPGAEMGGWAATDTGGIFGQWLSGMARIYKATGDTEMRDKAVYLMTEWGKVFAAGGKPSARASAASHYLFDKTACGLIDLQLYAGNKEAGELLDRLGDWGIKNLNRTKQPPDVILNPSLTKPSNIAGPRSTGTEWYTLSENLYRAYELTGDEKYRTFGDVWHYPQYWSKFTSPDPIDLHGLHAYSHVNTLSSAAMAYAVHGDPHFLSVITSAHDNFQAEQNFATGGFGPVEQLSKADGSLGRSVEFESSTFETGCGSWAVFKLGRYLLEFTGDARYGDWIERILYNGISAALPMADRQNPYFDDIWTEHGWGPDRGRTFYYADYRLGGGRKEYYPAPWPCCAGTYIQDVADYHNLIYFHDSDGLYVNLFVPSKVEWSHQGSTIAVTQKTNYPEAEVTALMIGTDRKAAFDLKLRVPPWAEATSIKVNGKPFPAAVSPNTWATLHREWSDGDVVEFHLPMRLRTVPIDKYHPNRVAIAYGPVVLAQEQKPILAISKHDPHAELRPADKPLQFIGSALNAPLLKPFYSVGYATPYAIYFDV